VTNKTVFLIFLFMSFFLAIIIVGAIMSGEEFQQPGSPTPPQDEEAKGSKTIPLQTGRGSPIENGGETILIWSSNKPDGYGRKEIPVTKIKRAVFSRLEDPRKIEGLLTLSKKDPYLAELERRPSTVNEMLQKIAIPPEVKPKPTQATPISESPKSNRENEGANQVNGTSDRLSPTPSLSQAEKAPKDTHNPQRVLPPKDQDDPGATPHPGDDH
jgi:hypothetical protein